MSRGFTLDPVGTLCVALLLLTVANLIRIPAIATDDRTAPILFNDLCVGIALAVGGVWILRQRTLRLDPVTLAAALFATIGLVSAVAGVPRFSLTGFELLVSLAYLARWIFYFSIYVMVVNCVQRGDARRVWWALESAVLVFAAFGIVQAIFLPGFAQMVYPDSRLYADWDPQGHRLVSTVLEPNIAAAMILVVLLVQLALLSAGAGGARWKPMLLLVALIATLSRSGILGLLAGGALILVWLGARKQLLRFGLFVALAAAAVSPQLVNLASQYSRFSVSDPSTLGRLVSWSRAINTFLDHPWFGIGFNTYGFVQERMGYERMGGASYSVEGGLLFAAVMTGIVGLIVFGTMLWLVIRRCAAMRLSPDASPWERGLVTGVAAATVGVVSHSIFVNSLFTPYVMELLWVLWGLAAVVQPGSRSRVERPSWSLVPST